MIGGGSSGGAAQVAVQSLAIAVKDVKLCGTEGQSACPDSPPIGIGFVIILIATALMGLMMRLHARANGQDAAIRNRLTTHLK